MTTDDQIMALFERANPVPDPDAQDIDASADRILGIALHRSNGAVALVASATDSAGPRRQRWTMVGIAASVLALLLVAGLVLLDRDSNREDVAAPTTEASAPAGQSGGELTAPASGETQRTVIGDITWTLVEGDGSTQPERVTIEIDGEFLGVDEDGQTFRSSDGISWQLTEPIVDGLRDVVDFDGETWGTVFSAGERAGLVRWDGTTFAPVELPESLAPTVEGLQRFGPALLAPVALGDELVVPVSSGLEVPWSDLYSSRVFPEWDAVTETIRLRDPASADPLPVAVLTAELVAGDPGGVEFRDAETGEVVTTVDLIAGIDSDEFLRRMVAGGITHSEFLVGDRDGFEVVGTPWSLAEAPRVAALDGRLLAIVEYIRFEDVGFGAQEWELWTSTDARSWEPLELPTPFGSRVDNIEIVSDGSLALLTIVSSEGSVQRPETWSTADGMRWSSAEGAAGFGGIQITDVGWVRTEFEESIGVSVSPDGLTWQEIPIDLDHPSGAGNGDVSVQGHTIFLTMNENGGERTMWVGRVDDG